jgi:hypothetical protein
MVAARDLKHMHQAPQDRSEMRIPHTETAQILGNSASKRL